MIEQTFYKGFEIRKHTFTYNGERRLIGYGVRKTLQDGTVIPYRRKSKNKTAMFSEIYFDTEQAAKRAIDAGEVVEEKPRRRKRDVLTTPARTAARK